jgi:nucleoside 2-deoxyribosyltransferase
MKARVYLAGPDVFHKDHARIFSQRVSICERLGLEALVPFDNKVKTAADIYRFNVRMLDLCDAVIANITPFRGPHCDVGTAWEIGYAVGRRKLVEAFSGTAESLAARVSGGNPKARFDGQGMSIEGFGLPENLMITEALADRTVHASFEAAAEAVARHMKRKRRSASRAAATA